MMFNLDVITKGKFRILVLGVIISLFYDLIWFYIKHSEYSPSDNVNTGSVEANVKKFSLFMSYVSFFFRVYLKSNDFNIVYCSNSFVEGFNGLL